jgi:AcrR family transcriptional regulator
MNPTRAKLLASTAEVLRDRGIAGISARTIAAHAGVNQALVFYHFGTVAELIDAACRHAVDESADSYREQLAAISSLTELLALGRALHAQERQTGHVALMAQLMSGAQQVETLAASARYAMERWNLEIESAVRRVLRRSPLADVMEPAGLARAISAGFIGLELYEGVDPDGAELALATLETLGVLVEAMDDLGPIPRRALRARLKRAPK